MGEERYNGTFLFGVILGACIGACVALFFTPLAGWETRGQIKARYNALLGSGDGNRR